MKELFSDSYSEDPKELILNQMDHVLMINDLKKENEGLEKEIENQEAIMKKIKEKLNTLYFQKK